MGETMSNLEHKGVQFEIGADNRTTGRLLADGVSVAFGGRGLAREELVSRLGDEDRGWVLRGVYDFAERLRERPQP